MNITINNKDDTVKSFGGPIIMNLADENKKIHELIVSTESVFSQALVNASNIHKNLEELTNKYEKEKQQLVSAISVEHTTSSHARELIVMLRFYGNMINNDDKWKEFVKHPMHTKRGMSSIPNEHLNGVAILDEWRKYTNDDLCAIVKFAFKHKMRWVNGVGYDYIEHVIENDDKASEFWSSLHEFTKHHPHICCEYNRFVQNKNDLICSPVLKISLLNESPSIFNFNDLLRGNYAKYVSESKYNVMKPMFEIYKKQLLDMHEPDKNGLFNECKITAHVKELFNFYIKNQ